MPWGPCSAGSGAGGIRSGHLQGAALPKGTNDENPDLVDDFTNVDLS